MIMKGYSYVDDLNVLSRWERIGPVNVQPDKSRYISPSSLIPHLHVHVSLDHIDYDSDHSVTY
jgi:hypothetical protein